MFEHVIAERLEVYLWTNDNQFGFKSGHSTDLCIYALTEFIEYFKSRSTSVYVAFLDASKAFDKISHWTLFRKLMDRCVPLYLVVILCYWYQKQEMTALLKIKLYIYGESLAAAGCKRLALNLRPAMVTVK